MSDNLILIIYLIIFLFSAALLALCIHWGEYIAALFPLLSILLTIIFLLIISRNNHKQ